MRAEDLHLIIDEHYALHPHLRDRHKCLLLFDEIQLVPGWETFIRRVMDTERVDVWLSGSSAKLLGRDLATSMRGRSMTAIVHPFSFREFLRHVHREPKGAPGRLPKAARSTLDADLSEYLHGGGFPEAAGAAVRERKELLQGYVDSVLLRDIVERYGISNATALRWVVRQLLANPAGSLSVHKLYNDLKSQGISTSKDTLHALVGHLEDAFLIRTVSLHTRSERRRMVNPRKAYPIDPGLISVFDRSGESNAGHCLETCVMLELERAGAELSYVRTAAGNEVDFLARFPGGDEELIQVCAGAGAARVRDRELRALAEAS